MSWVEQVLESLSAAGHRLTTPRRVILERMIAYPHPFSAEQLWLDLTNDARVKGTEPIGRATIYRTVELLVDAHWLSRVHWSPARDTNVDTDHAYVPVDQGHQHHLVCKSCGTVVTFEGCQIDELLSGLAKRLNFRVDGHWLEAFGTCQACQLKAA